jgi:branched-chain amino acid transport system substrate-binding protein
MTVAPVSAVTPRRRLGLGLAALFGTIALLGSACSSSDQATPADASDAGAGPVVTIGVIAPIDAGLTAYGRGISASVQLAVAEANARDAIPGYTIKVDARNDSSDPSIGEAAAETLAADATVIGVIGTYNSGVAAKVAPVLHDAGITMISPGNTDPTLTRGPNLTSPERQWDTYFRVVATDAEQGDVLAAYARADLAASSAAIVAEDKSVSRGLADDFSSAFTNLGGAVVLDTVVPDKTTEFAAVASAIAAANPSVAFFGGEYDSAGPFSAALVAAGYTGPVVGGDGMKDDEFIALAGGAAEGDIATTVGQPLNQSQSPEYFEAYAAAGYLDPPSPYGPYAFDAANVLIDAAAEALADTTGGVNRAVRDEVRSLVQSTSTQGITGEVAFDEFGDTVNQLFTVFQVIDDRWTVVVSRRAD